MRGFLVLALKHNPGRTHTHTHTHTGVSFLRVPEEDHKPKHYFGASPLIQHNHILPKKMIP